MKERLRDIINAVRDDAIDYFINSDELPEVINNGLDIVLSESVASLLSGILGAALPRVNAVISNYKQNRFERNVRNTLQIMMSRIESIENNYSVLNEEIQEKYRGLYAEWLLDGLGDEPQEEKVPYYVNGYINLMNNEVNDNLMLMYFNTITQMTNLDIEVLKMYDINSAEDIFSISEKYHLEFDQIRVIKEKLSRLGMINSKNDDIRDKNIDNVVDYLKKVEKDNKKSKPQGVRLPNMKKTNGSDSYSISVLGRNYLKIMLNNDVLM